ncbi:hypothetical protein XA68_13687 [Ophiocordyceps unilateralis]|uniref:Uncharacterized protein n=1 Tax=Ophiocordyceps unilateralis TaxID=268505 RepID=A0A2A9PA93_OPHUN|nr:hypothetical protein XA68_13687 [Ophiocordyceps unilateralis]
MAGFGGREIFRWQDRPLTSAGPEPRTGRRRRRRRSASPASQLIESFKSALGFTVVWSLPLVLAMAHGSARGPVRVLSDKEECQLSLRLVFVRG